MTYLFFACLKWGEEACCFRGGKFRRLPGHPLAKGYTECQNAWRGASILFQESGWKIPEERISEAVRFKERFLGRIFLLCGNKVPAQGL